MEHTHDMLTHGVNIVTAAHDGKRAGLAVAWATQVGTDHVLVCIGKQSHTRELILASRAFGLSVLAADQLDVSKRFGLQSSRKVDKFEGLGTHTLETGSPLLDDCALALDCRVAAVHEHGTARLIVGEIVAAERIRESCEPLLYRESDYS